MSRAGTIDGLKFARERGAISGTLGIADLPRLAELGCEHAALRYEVRGEHEAGGISRLVVDAAGEVRLTCQRCCSPVDLAVAPHSELVLAAAQAEIDAAEDDIDRVVAGKAMDVAALIEDEVMLALPMVPMHERCEQRVAPDEAATASPFSALARLRKDGTDTGNNRSRS
jgi:uncharacterized protein